MQLFSLYINFKLQRQTELCPYNLRYWTDLVKTVLSTDLYLSPNSSEKILSVMSTVLTQDFQFITENLCFKLRVWRLKDVLKLFQAGRLQWKMQQTCIMRNKEMLDTTRQNKYGFYGCCFCENVFLKTCHLYGGAIYWVLLLISGWIKNLQSAFINTETDF